MLLELRCETDFVAKNSEFQRLAKDICLHIAASSPAYICREEVPPELIAKERDIAMAQVAGKPANAIERIVEGKLEKWYQQVCLLEQPFIHDQDKTVKDAITSAIAIIGENIQIGRFARYQIGG